MQRKKKSKEVQEKLDAFNHSRPREMMPRPTVFKDKTKYDRNKRKNDERRGWEI